MKHSTSLFIAVLLFSSFTVFAQFDTLTYAKATSSPVRLDLRDGFGGRVVRGSLALSMEEGAVTCQGQALGALWDTTMSSEGWHTLVCGGETAQVCVRNDAGIALEEGRLAANTTWDNTAVHVVRNDVYVPSGVTLTLADGTIVKFAEDCRIIVEYGGKIVVNGSSVAPVQFAQVADDGVGGDTDLKEAAVVAETASRIYCHESGAWQDNGCFVVNQVVISTLPNLSVQAVRAMRQGGSVRIPVSVSGTRNSSFAVDWEAVDGTAKYGVDFTSNSGCVNWTSTSAGSGYIDIPLVTESQSNEDLAFTVRLVRSYGANIGIAEALVTLYDNADSEFENLRTALATSESVRLDMRDDFGGRIAQGVVAISSTEGDVLLNGQALGENWDTTAVEDGWFELAQGNETREVAVLNSEAVHCEEGRLKTNTTWDNSVVHVVRNDVYIPSGITLTITEGATVKFTADSRIIVENGGKLQMNGSADAYVQFAMATDDGYAGNTDMRDVETVFPSYSVIYCYGNGTVADNGYVASRGLVISSTYPTLALNNASVYEDCGTVYIPVTVSGSRNTSFYVEWEASNGTATFGEDYNLASGRLIWNSTNDGTRYIAIPITAGHLAADEEDFTIRFVASGGANINTTAKTVAIRRRAGSGLENFAYATCGSNAARLDLREGFGGRIIRGNMAFSTTEGKVYLEGNELPSNWNSTAMADGWHELSQNNLTEEICLLNNEGISLEEGRLKQNTTWNGTSLHLLRNDVYVPNGVTLTIADGAIVKFTEDTRIIVENGGKLSVQGAENAPVRFALATDDVFGGDTDMREGDMDKPSYSLVYCYNTDTGWTDNGQFTMRDVIFNKLPTVSIHNSRIMEHEGIVKIPVTVSGTRKAAFSVDWIAQDGTAKLGSDYTLASGRLSWTSTDNGTRYIEIPIVSDATAEDLEEFSVFLTASAGTNIGTPQGTVSIVESELFISANAQYSNASDETEEPVELDERTDLVSRLARETEHLRYSARWAASDAAASVRVTAMLDLGDEEPHEIFMSADTTDGVVEWKTSGLEMGRYILAHETLDQQGRVLDRLVTRFFINRDIIVHYGSLTADEAWDDSAIHLVSSSVIVPAGVTLTISNGAIVKFQSGSGIVAKLGSVVECNGAIFTHIADDSIGGDTNMDGYATAAQYDAYAIEGEGAIHMDSSCKLLCKSALLPSGTLSSNMVLSGNLVYKATGNLTIASGVTLTIEPGAILKFGSGQCITVNSGATLQAIGTRAQPIIFTSIKDDTHGGDTNGDGDKTSAQPGDWGTLLLKGGYGEFAYCSFLYAAGTAGNQYNASANVFMWEGGSGSFKSCIFAHSPTDGCFAQQSTFENCIFTDCDRGLVSHNLTIKVNNCIFYDNAHGAVGHGGTMNISNSIFYQNLEADVSNLGTTPNVRYSCSHSENQSNIRGGYTKVAIANGVNGNITMDPLFTDAANGDFTIKAESPCIDAGDGSVAPELDYFGQPRQEIRDVVATGTPSENGAVPDIGIHEMLPKNAAATVDLLVVSVELKEAAVQVNEPLNVSWTLRNDGSDAAQGSWRDYVYLVNENGEETLLGIQTTKGSIAANGLRTMKGTFNVPEVNEGTYSIRVKANLNRDIFEGALTANNIATSETMVEITYPKAAVKDGIAGSLGAGNEVVKLLDVEEGYSLALINAPKGTKVYYSLGSIPTAESHISSVTCLAGETMLSLPTGEVYLLVVAPHDEACDYSINFTEDTMQIQSVSQTRLYSNGKSFVHVHGSRFPSDSEAFLIKGTERIAVSSYIPGDNDIWITIDNEKLSPGNYDLEVQSSLGNAMLENAFQVSAEEGTMALSYQVIQPASARVGRVFTASIEFENTGNVAMPAPIFVLEAPYRNFIVNGQTYEQKVMLYGVGSKYPYGYLQPGVKQTLTFQMQITSNSDSGLNYQAFHAGTAGAERQLYAEDLYSKEYLEYLKDSELEEYAALLQSIGNTWGDFYNGMATFVTQNVSKQVGNALTFEMVKQEFLDNVHQTSLQDNVVTQANLNGMQGTKGACSLPSESRLGGNPGLISDKYKKINDDFSTYDFSSKPLRYDFAGDNSYPGQIWWYHAACHGWHRIGFMNTPYDEVIAQISNNSEWYLLCHGNECSIHEKWLEEMASAIHAKKANANVFAVDWGDISQVGWNGTAPEDTAPLIPYVATEAVRQLGKIQETLSQKRHFSLPISGLTIIGHSHGGHLGGIIAKHLDGKPKRLIGLDSSPMWTHTENGHYNGNYIYPSAWDSNVAQNVEFYKTSWGFSMGSSDDSEVFGRPSFFVTMNGDFSRDLYSPNSLNGKLDGAGLSLNRHGYSHDWLIDTISSFSGGKFGWTWKNENWSDVSFGNSSISGSGFYGVIRNGEMELGSNCVDEINNSRREGQPIITSDTWRYDALVLNRSFDSLLGLNNFGGLDRLWNLWSMLVEYRANFLTVNGSLNDAMITAGRKIKVDFSISNVADNRSINAARRSSHYNNKKGRNRYPSVVPWSYQVGGVECGIANTIQVYDLQTLSQTELENLKSEVKNFNFDTLQNTIASCDHDLLYSWDEYLFGLLDAGSGIVFNKNIEFAPQFTHRTWELGRRQNGQVYDKEKGEPFLIVGKAAAFRVGDVYSQEYYPGDLYFGDNIWATIVYVQPSKGELEARLVAFNETNGSTGTGNGFVQQEIFEVTTDDDGGWSIELSAAKSICRNGLKYYYWETKGFSPSSSQTTVAILEPIGFLNEDEKEHDYKISLTVCDLLDQTDTVEVTIRVKRPEEKCVNCTPDTCICAPGECNCPGCKKRDSKPDKPQSCDPNEMAGMYGFGDAATQRFVQPGEEMTYTIYFENKADATAAAQEVKVTSKLSQRLDWSTFRIEEVGFRNQIDRGLSGKSDGASEVVLEGTSWKVRTEVELNQKNGNMTCYMRIVDETTIDGWPESAYDGFLPPNDDKHSGEGYIRYKVKVRSDAPLNNRIDASATIVFDYNEPITTSPAWFNWVGTDTLPADTGYLTWDAKEGATYSVTIWTSEADFASDKAIAVANSGLLNTNRWRLPSNLTKGTTYFWQVTTIEAEGERTLSPVWGFEMDGRVVVDLAPGWNLLSIPFKLEDYTARQLLGRKLFTLQDHSYVKATSLETGRAYWLMNNNAKNNKLDFIPANASRAQNTAELQDGWNMLGPSENTNISDERISVWQYVDGEWQYLPPGEDSQYDLNIGQGYWIYQEPLEQIQEGQ